MKWRAPLLLLLIITVIVLFTHRSPRPPDPATNVSPPQAETQQPDPRPGGSPKFTTRGAEMSPQEKADLSKKFEQEFRPALQKWCSAYEHHAPVTPDDLTIDKFHSRLGNHLYTFMINGHTLSIRESKGTATVAYLWAPQAKALNQLPSQGTAPDLSVPVTRDEIIRMVRADSGVEFKPNEVIIRPTGAACAVMGGAFVHLIPTGADPNNALSSKIDLVFGPDGKLLNYERDPFL